ncbi:hypothetical protein AAH979_42360 [Plantactinospora sp. ZYX-F-223]|uniref:hypothetical protein n=1 Tax=Plantactinospora sp. ZYX-F-223 TaxID=3144103 RepID=UPI0031FD9944
MLGKVEERPARTMLDGSAQVNAQTVAEILKLLAQPSVQIHISHLSSKWVRNRATA